MIGAIVIDDIVDNIITLNDSQIVKALNREINTTRPPYDLAIDNL